MSDSSLRLDCAVDAAMSVIEGKWKAVVICKIGHNGKMRFNELIKEIPSISSKVLTNQLRELEGDGIIQREASATSKRVTYSLTSKGIALGPALIELAKWGRDHMSFTRVIFDETVDTEVKIYS